MVWFAGHLRFWLEVRVHYGFGSWLLGFNIGDTLRVFRRLSRLEREERIISGLQYLLLAFGRCLWEMLDLGNWGFGKQRDMRVWRRVLQLSDCSRLLRRFFFLSSRAARCTLCRSPASCLTQLALNYAFLDRASVRVRADVLCCSFPCSTVFRLPCFYLCARPLFNRSASSLLISVHLTYPSSCTQYVFFLFKAFTALARACRSFICFHLSIRFFFLLGLHCCIICLAWLASVFTSIRSSQFFLLPSTLFPFEPVRFLSSFDHTVFLACCDAFAGFGYIFFPCHAKARYLSCGCLSVLSFWGFCVSGVGVCLMILLYLGFPFIDRSIVSD